MHESERSSVRSGGANRDPDESTRSFMPRTVPTHPLVCRLREVWHDTRFRHAPPSAASRRRSSSGARKRRSLAASLDSRNSSRSALRCVAGALATASTSAAERHSTSVCLRGGWCGHTERLRWRSPEGVEVASAIKSINSDSFPAFDPRWVVGTSRPSRGRARAALPPPDSRRWRRPPCRATRGPACARTPHPAGRLAWSRTSSRIRTHRQAGVARGPQPTWG